MKEADIKFGSLYAVEISNATVCKKVCSKVAPEKGKQRSRTYVIVNQGEEVSSYPDTIDASKIKMLWSDYERTDEYAWNHIGTMERNLQQRVLRELGSWWALVGQCVASLTGARVSNSFVPHNMQTATTSQEIMDAMREIQVSVSIGTLIDLAEVPIPAMNGVTSAIEMRDEVLKDLRTKMIPAAEKALTDSFVYGGTQLDDWSHDHLLTYVHLLRDAGTPGPHAGLVALAKGFPTISTLRSLTAEPQFSYLMQYLKS